MRKLALFLAWCLLSSLLTPGVASAQGSGPAVRAARQVAEVSPSGALQCKPGAHTKPELPRLGPYPGAEKSSRCRGEAVSASSVKAAAGQYVPIPPALPIVNVSMAANGVHTARLTGVHGVPAAGEVSAVAMHVIVVQPAAAGWLQVFPAGPRHAANSTMNYGANRYSSSFEVVPVSSAGDVSFYSTAATRLYVRLLGYYTSAAATAAGGTYVPLAPTRLANAVTLAAGASTTLTVAGVNGVAAADKVTAVSVVVVAGTPGAAGFLQVFPTGVTPNDGHAGLYFPASETRSLLHVLPVSADGKITVKASVAIKLSMYLRGYYQRPTATDVAGASYVPVEPATVANNVALAANGSTTLNLAGANGIPAARDVAAVATNIASATPTGTGYLQTWPDEGRPVDASLYYANAVPQGEYDITRIRDDGRTVVAVTAATRIYTRLRGYFKRANAPAAPSAVTATAGDRHVSATWTPPTSDGGAAVTGYTVTANPGGHAITVSSAETSAEIGGLTNGKPYTITVVATNAAGDSPPSVASDPVTPNRPEQPPGAPFITDTYPRDRSVRVSWSPPDTGIYSVTKYVVVASPGGASVEASPDATEAVVTGLTNGTRYTFTVTAANGVGNGPASSPSAAIAPEPAEAPLPPVVTVTIPLNERIDVQWSAPTDGGSPLTGYTVTAQPGDHTVTVPADTTVATLTGLSNNTAHTVTVTATNAAGASAPGTVTGITPAAQRAPLAPTDVRAAAASTGSANIEWKPPVDAGTSPITGYTVIATPGGATANATANRATIQGLNPATTYTFTVTASNAVGTSAASTPTSGIIPKVTVKSAPRVLSPIAMAALREVHSDGTLDFRDPPLEVMSLTPGNLLILRASHQAPMGMFRKVTGVKTINGLVVVTTGPAAINEALDDGALAVNAVVDSSDITGFTARSPGVRLQEPTAKGRTLRNGAPKARAFDTEPSIGLRDGTLVLAVESRFGPDTGLNSKLAATLKLTPSADGDMGISASGVNTNFKLRLKQDIQARVKIGVAKNWSHTRRLASIRIGCIEFVVGPVPVFICLNFDVNLKLSADGSVGIAVSTGYVREYGVDIRSRGGDVDATPVNQPGQFDAPDFDVYGDASATVAVPLGLTLYFYGLAGPGVEAAPYLKAIADTTLDPWWELREGVQFSAYFRSVEFFGRSINFSRDFADVWRSIKDAGGPFNGMTIVPQHAHTQPGISTQLRVDVSHHPDDIPVQWKVIEGPGHIDQDGRYSSEFNGTALIEAVGTLPGVRSDQVVAQGSVQVGGAPPGAPRELSAVPGPLSASVKWSPPLANPDGLAITGYVLTTQPPTTTTVVTGTVTTALVPNLDPRIDYTIQVYAKNDAGFGPPAQTGKIRSLMASSRLGSITNLAVDEQGKPDNTGTVGNRSIALAGNGRFVFFTVEARSNLAPPEVSRPNDTTTYVVRKNLDTGQIDLASRAPDGTTPMAAASEPMHHLKGSGVATNLDGTVVAFLSNTTPPTLYVHNLTTGRSWRASDGVPPDHIVDSPVLSDDGNTVAFRAAKWTSTVGARLYRRVINQNLEHVGSANNCGGWTVCRFGLVPSISGDGKRIAYEGAVERIPDGGGDIQSIPTLVYDAPRRTTIDLFPNNPVRNDPLGWLRLEYALSPAISKDGNVVSMDYFLLFQTNAGNRALKGLVLNRVGSGQPGRSDIVISANEVAAGGKAPALNRTGTIASYDPYAQGGRLYDAVSKTQTTITQEGYTDDYYRVQLSDNGQFAAWNLLNSGGVWGIRYSPAGVCRPDKYYAPLDGQRATRITAKYCNKKDLEGGTEASPSILPPGFPVPNPDRTFSRGHLLGRQLGGNGGVKENLVTLYQTRANNPSMRDLETRVKDAVVAGEEVSYEVFPIYNNTQAMPTGIVIKADGNRGLHISKLVENTEEGRVIDYP